MNEVQDPTAGEIIIRRNEDRDIKMRGLEVFLDGKFARDLSYGATCTKTVSAGAHTVKVTNHLYTKTLELEVQPGERITLSAGNAFTLIGGLMISVLGMGPYKVFLSEAGRELQTVVGSAAGPEGSAAHSTAQRAGTGGSTSPQA